MLACAYVLDAVIPLALTARRDYKHSDIQNMCVSASIHSDVFTHFQSLQRGFEIDVQCICPHVFSIGLLSCLMNKFFHLWLTVGTAVSTELDHATPILFSMDVPLDRFALALLPLFVWWIRQSGTQEIRCQRIDRLESAKECLRAACSEVEVVHTWQVFPILACALSSAVLITSDVAIGDSDLVSPVSAWHFPLSRYRSLHEAARNLSHGRLVRWVSEWSSALTTFQQISHELVAAHHPDLSDDKISIFQAYIAQLFDGFLLLRASLAFIEHRNPDGA